MLANIVQFVFQWSDIHYKLMHTCHWRLFYLSCISLGSWRYAKVHVHLHPDWKWLTVFNSDDFCCLLITFQNNLHPDQDRQHIGSDLDLIVIIKCFCFEKIDFETSVDDKRGVINSKAFKKVKYFSLCSWIGSIIHDSCYLSSISFFKKLALFQHLNSIFHIFHIDFRR